MDTINDDYLSLASRVYRQNGQNRLAVSALAAFSFSGENASAAYLPQAEIWSLAAPVMKDGMALEEGFAKPGKEFFVYGSAFAPPGTRKAKVATAARVGDLARRIEVNGDRAAAATGVGEAKPFASMPVDWRHAYGGPDSPDNPLGKGMPPDGKGAARQLPNLVDPDDKRNASPPRPAAYLPAGSGWPVRSAAPATRDAEWLQSGGPSLPPDFDRSWFMTAHPSQRGIGSFKPGEPFAVAGMHPEKAKINSSLPLETPWARVERLTANSVEPLAVPMNLDTVWLFPEQEKGVLVWHGEVPVADADASDALCLRGGFGPEAEETAAPPVEPPPAEPPPPLAAPPILIQAAAESAAMPKPTPLSIEETAAETASRRDAAPAESEPEAEPEAKAEPEPMLTQAERDRKVVADARRQMHESLDALSSEANFLEGGDELAMANDILSAKGMTPLDPATYRSLVAGRLDAMREAIDSIPDRVLLENADPSERYGALDEKSAAELLVDRAVEAGVPRDKAEEITADLFVPMDIDPAMPLSELMETRFGFNLAELGIDPAMLDDPVAFGPSDEEKRRVVDAELVKRFGKDLETLVSPEDDTFPSLLDRAGIEEAVDDAELIERFKPLLDLAFAESGATEQALDAAEKAFNPEDAAIRKMIIEKYAPDEKKDSSTSDVRGEGDQPDQPIGQPEPPSDTTDPNAGPPPPEQAPAAEDGENPSAEAEIQPPSDKLPPPDDVFGDALL